MLKTPKNKREKNSLLNPLYLYKNKGRIVPFIHYNILRDLRSFFSLLGIHLCDNDRQLASFKNIHKNDRCFILGNGPSLNIADLDRLQDEITFACNKIYLAFTETAWRPTYYAVEDDLVILQNHATINELSGFTKFFPERTKKLAPPFKNSLYFNLGLQKRYSDTPNFSNNALSKLYHGATIVYTMIQLACFMGFKEIYLLGVDFNFSFNNNEIKGTVIRSEGESNHFHPDYRKSGEKWHKPRLQDQERAFLVARESTKKLNCEILDATRNGKLTVFQKINLDTILK
jgi:hypothetical protein